MSNCLNRNLPFLELIHQSQNNKQIRALLTHITPDQVRALMEISNHLISGHCKLDKQTRLFLRKNINTLNKMASRNISYSAKKKIINQKGGGFKKLFPVILKAILKTKDLVVKHKKVLEGIASVAAALL